MYNVDAYRILIASPSDVCEEREIISNEIKLWNTHFSREYGAVLVPVMWEIDSASRLGEHPQEVLNKQMDIENCDALIGVFGIRIGTSTDKAESGTIEEINTLLDIGKLVMLYFSDVPIQPSKIEISQYKKLLEFQKKVNRSGFIKRYKSLEEFSKVLQSDLIKNIGAWLLKRKFGQREINMRRGSALNQEVHTDEICERIKGDLSELVLVDSFPKDNQSISAESVRKIYLKFNKPIDRETVTYIGNYYIADNSFCQWDVGGYVQFSEDDTKLTWCANEETLNNKKWYEESMNGQPAFEIHIGRNPKNWRVRAIDGSILEIKHIRVKVNRNGEIRDVMSLC